MSIKFSYCCLKLQKYYYNFNLVNLKNGFDDQFFDKFCEWYENRQHYINFSRDELYWYEAKNNILLHYKLSLMYWEFFFIFKFLTIIKNTEKQLQLRSLMYSIFFIYLFSFVEFRDWRSKKRKKLDRKFFVITIADIAKNLGNFMVDERFYKSKIIDNYYNYMSKFFYLDFFFWNTFSVVDRLLRFRKEKFLVSKNDSVKVHKNFNSLGIYGNYLFEFFFFSIDKKKPSILKRNSDIMVDTMSKEIISWNDPCNYLHEFVYERAIKDRLRRKNAVENSVKLFSFQIKESEQFILCFEEVLKERYLSNSDDFDDKLIDILYYLLDFNGICLYLVSYYKYFLNFLYWGKFSIQYWDAFVNNYEIAIHIKYDDLCLFFDKFKVLVFDFEFLFNIEILSEIKHRLDRFIVTNTKWIRRLKLFFQNSLKGLLEKKIKRKLKERKKRMERIEFLQLTKRGLNIDEETKRDLGYHRLAEFEQEYENWKSLKYKTLKRIELSPLLTRVLPTKVRKLYTTEDGMLTSLIKAPDSEEQYLDKLYDALEKNEKMFRKKIFSVGLKVSKLLFKGNILAVEKQMIIDLKKEEQIKLQEKILLRKRLQEDLILRKESEALRAIRIMKQDIINNKKRAAMIKEKRKDPNYVYDWRDDLSADDLEGPEDLEQQGVGPILY